ncbi:hypothetical protein LCGC14_1115690 [marine sediment metagenome]|uniref:Uncharacterized protein n=1 Tax=marine sediment metagenome TaxID=412755 RepID=A0A0F9MA51_9ZZZZ
MSIEEILKMDIPDLEVNKEEWRNITDKLEETECLHHKMQISVSSLSILLDAEPIKHDINCKKCDEIAHFIIKYQKNYFIFIKERPNNFFRILGMNQNKLEELMKKLRERYIKLEMFMEVKNKNGKM